MDATVFISYARADTDAMRSLAAGLTASGFRVLLDTSDIGPAEVWRARLSDLIRQSDSLVFLISPTSVRSADCRWELDEAERHEKRIFPLRVRETVDGDIPGRLLQLNHIMGYPDERPADALDQLTNALRVDLAWVRQHTVFEELSQRWIDSRQDPSRLLRGKDIERAEQWRDRRPKNAPELTGHQRRFITASRKNVEVTARRRTLIASGAAVLAILAAIALNEMRVSSGLSAFEAEVTAEANSIIESMNHQNEAHALRRALHAYSAAERTLKKPPDIVWNALRQAYAQYRIESTFTTERSLTALTMPSDNEIVAIDTEGDLWSFDLTLQAPKPIPLEQPLQAAEAYGFSPSNHSVWARRDSHVRFHDLSGERITSTGDFRIGEDVPFDAVPGCIAIAGDERVTVLEVSPQGQREILNASWSSGEHGTLGAIRLSIDCNRALLVGGSSSLLYQRSTDTWTHKEIDVATSEVWSASPNLRFIVSAYANSRDLNRYDTNDGSWNAYYASVSSHYGDGQNQSVGGVLIAEDGAMIIRIASEIVALSPAGALRLRSSGSILPTILALSPNGEWIVTHKVTARTLSLISSTKNPLFETVLNDVALPDAEYITTLANCGDVIAVGGSGGSVLLHGVNGSRPVPQRYDARAYVRRIDCRDGKPAMISSEFGALDVRRQPSTWVPEKLGALSSYSGRAVFPDIDDGLLVVSSTAVSRYASDGIILESIDRPGRDDDVTVVGGGVLMQAEPRRLLLLGEAAQKRNGRYGARACAYLWDGSVPVQTICKASPPNVRFSAGGFLDDSTIVGAGLGGNLSIMPLNGQQLDLDGAPQFVPHAMVRMDQSKFALSSMGGELHIWTRGGTLLQPSLSVPKATGSVGIAIDPKTSEILVASGRSILRTVLGGARLKENGCEALARTERTRSPAPAYCMRSAPLSPLHLRVSAVPTFVPLN